MKYQNILFISAAFFLISNLNSGPALILGKKAFNLATTSQQEKRPNPANNVLFNTNYGSTQKSLYLRNDPFAVRPPLYGPLDIIENDKKRLQREYIKNMTRSIDKFKADFMKGQNTMDDLISRAKESEEEFEPIISKR